MIKIGMIIGDRYEILEKIGTGGMSDVYKAKCHKLNRFVAVKVLKQEFSENANFVSKFRIEAQAAAGLSHPNIVNVYDVGEENSIYYIVMELVEGITLKKYIEKKARLSVKEAITIAIQICMGIEAAHNNHIIHRDIKPQNIIISKEGKVKVTDFGIAKAATSNTITSNVMGSVHYTSPEQARGGFSDAKSDVYSLGITLFEMLTGRVAFNGETTVAIAIKHIQEEMPSPREFVSEIPVSVEQIVYKCCQKSPDRRYQTMGELINDLKKSLMNPDEDFVKVVDVEGEGATRSISEIEVAQIKTAGKNGSARNGKPAREDGLMRESELRETKATREGQVRETRAGREGSAEREIRPAQEGGAAYEARLAQEDSAAYEARPAREGSTAYEAGSVQVRDTRTMRDARSVRDRGFKAAFSEGHEFEGEDFGEYEGIYEGNYDGSYDGNYYENVDSDEDYTDDYADDYDPRMERVTTVLAIVAAILIGCVVIVLVGRAFGLFQFEWFGDKAPEEEQVAAVEQVEMIKVVGLKLEEAKVALIGIGLTPEIRYEESTEFESGIVMKSSAAQGDMVDLGSNVILTASTGSEGVEVPELIGKTEAEAKSILEQAGFLINRAEGYDDYIKAGSVFYQEPASGSNVPKETTVTIRVSLGKEDKKIQMPDLIGQTEMDATVILMEAGLTVGSVVEGYHDDPTLNGLVCSQSYSAGLPVEKGTTVNLEVSIGPAGALYGYNGNIAGPTADEDPNFKSGTMVTVTFTAADGTQLLSTQTESFPIAVDFSNIKAANGTILFQYVNTKEAQTITNEDGTTSTIDATTENKEVPREVAFIQQQ